MEAMQGNASIEADEEVCDYCRRPFTTAHPNPKVLQERHDAKLPRRAPRSKECICCFEYTALAYPAEVGTPLSKRAFKQRLIADPHFLDLLHYLAKALRL